MTLTCFVLTVGEEITFKTLAALKSYTKIPFELVIWYDNAHNKDFENRLRSESKRLIVSSFNNGIADCLQWAMITFRTDYLLICSADCVVKEGYWDRLITPFIEVPQMAMTGEAFRNLEKPYIVSDDDRGPDGVQLVSREAVNALGGIQATFQGYGHDILEWQRRAKAKGWHFAAVKDVCTHAGTQHEGREMNPAFEEECDRNSRLLLKQQKEGWTSYNWWHKDKSFV